MQAHAYTFCLRGVGYTLAAYLCPVRGLRAHVVGEEKTETTRARASFFPFRRRSQNSPPRLLFAVDTRGWRTRKHLFRTLLRIITVQTVFHFIFIFVSFFIVSSSFSHEGCKIGGGDVEVVPGVSGDCFQLCFTRFLGGPIGGICCVASARNASAIRCGCEFTIDLKPAVSITSVACVLMKSMACALS